MNSRHSNMFCLCLAISLQAIIRLSSARVIQPLFYSRRFEDSYVSSVLGSGFDVVDGLIDSFPSHYRPANYTSTLVQLVHMRYDIMQRSLSCVVNHEERKEENGDRQSSNSSTTYSRGRQLRALSNYVGGRYFLRGGFHSGTYRPDKVQIPSVPGDRR